MIKFRHVLADGTELDDITGHVVTLPEVYQVIAQLERRLAEEQREKEQRKPDKTA